MRRRRTGDLVEPLDKEEEAKQRQITMRTRVSLHPFLAGLDAKALSHLADCAIAAEFKPGQIILREGEQANRFYLIESGKVELEAQTPDGGHVVIDTIGAGELLGWSWMFSPYVWRFTARASEPTRVIFFYGEILRGYCERDHTLGYELFKRMAPTMVKRMQKARETLIGVHAGTISLKPVTVRESPFMDQELDLPEDDDE